MNIEVYYRGQKGRWSNILDCLKGDLKNGGN